MNEDINTICFSLISSGGEARSLFIEAIKDIRKNKIEDAKAKIKEGKELLNGAHKTHFEIIQEEAKGNKVEVVILLVHAEDIMMSAETFEILAESLLEEDC